MPYAALHNYSHFSVLDSLMAPEEIVLAAQASGMTAVGLTDRDTLAGAVAFYKKARALNLHPVIGSEVTLDDQTTLVLLVENARGYSNLCRLLTTRIDHSAGVTREDVARFATGLICLAGPRSAPAAAFRQNRPPEPSLRWLQEVFPGRLALELTPHHDDDLRIARLFAETARRLRIPIVAGVATHYLSPDDRLCYDILASMRTLTLLNQRHPESCRPDAITGTQKRTSSVTSARCRRPSRIRCAWRSAASSTSNSATSAFRSSPVTIP
jgi:error-prone DNA polymerase